MDYASGSKFERDLHSDIKGLIETGYDKPRDEAEFNDIALRLFRFQYETCVTYRRFCEAKGFTPTAIDGWENIPSLPADAMKYNENMQKQIMSLLYLVVHLLVIYHSLISVKEKE